MLSEETLKVRKCLYPEYGGERNFRQFWEKEFSELLGTEYSPEDYKDLFGSCKVKEDFEKDWERLGYSGFYRDSKAYVFHTAAYNLGTSWGMDMMKAFLRTYSGGKMLDYGGGCGNFNILAGGGVYIDRFGVFFDTAKKRFKKRKVEVDMVGASLHSVTQLNGQFDYIVCTEVLEHVEFALELAVYLANILTAGGKLLLTYSFGSGDTEVMHLAKYNKSSGRVVLRLLREEGLTLIFRDFKGHIKIFEKEGRK